MRAPRRFIVLLLTCCLPFRASAVHRSGTTANLLPTHINKPVFACRIWIGHKMDEGRMFWLLARTISDRSAIYRGECTEDGRLYDKASNCRSLLPIPFIFWFYISLRIEWAIVYVDRRSWCLLNPMVKGTRGGRSIPIEDGVNPKRSFGATVFDCLTF